MLPAPRTTFTLSVSGEMDPGVPGAEARVVGCIHVGCIELWAAFMWAALH